jgi:hypothetical protein
VGVYATPEAFMTANGSGSMGPVGATLFGRVNLSPVLGGAQHRRLAAILTHELSHAHLEGWMSTSAMIHLPSWFREGLAVMVSDGGGAEFVNEEEARAAIRRGEHIAIEQSGSLFNLFEIPFERAPLGVSASHQTVLAYRQAGMFVSYLRDSDGPGFARMMTAILDGRPFVEAVAAGYTEDIHALWQKFALASAERK